MSKLDWRFIWWGGYVGKQERGKFNFCRFYPTCWLAVSMSTLNTVCQSPRRAVLSSAADADVVLMYWNKKETKQQDVSINILLNWVKYYLCFKGYRRISLHNAVDHHFNSPLSLWKLFTVTDFYGARHSIVFFHLHSSVKIFYLSYKVV